MLCLVPVKAFINLFKAYTGKEQQKSEKNSKEMKSLFFFFLLLSLLVYLKNFSSLYLLGTLLISLASYFINVLWLKPLRLLWKLQRQGIKGPRPSFLYGNVQEMQKIQTKAMKAENFSEFVAHDYTSTIFPYFEQWRKEFGNILFLPLRLWYHL